MLPALGNDVNTSTMTHLEGLYCPRCQELLKLLHSPLLDKIKQSLIGAAQQQPHLWFLCLLIPFQRRA
jgi:hypothetical protein